MKTIHIIGLGAGDFNQLPLGVYRMLKSDLPIFLRTKEHPVVAELEKEGFHYRSFDEIYERQERFENVYENICQALLSTEEEELIYAVPGHPLVAERTVQLLFQMEKEGEIKTVVHGGQSFLDDMFRALRIDPIEGFQLLDATALASEEIQLRNHILVAQVYDTFIASNVKLTFMEKLPYDYEVYLVTAAGSKQERIKKIPLVDLDREAEVDNLTTVYIPPIKDESILYKDFAKLRSIIAELRGPNGCPWDLKQTHESLKKYMIEEAYEVVEAIQEGDLDHLIEELGDVLLQVLLHAQIGEDDGYFSVDDVIEGLSAKMIRRHPHVFGDKEAENAEEAVKNWQEIKQEEKGERNVSILDEVGKSLPTIIRSFELQRKAAKVGFDWPDAGGAWDKLLEEIDEFKEELSKDSSSKDALGEFGDILFALINIARFYDIHPDEALLMTNQKFMKRFRYIEKRVMESGRPFAEFTLEELDVFWNEAKKTGY